MKSAIYYGERDIRIEERPVPKAGRDGLVVKLKACEICPLIDLEM